MKYDKTFDFSDGVGVAVKENNSILYFLNRKTIRVSGVKLVTNFAEGLAVGKRGERYVLVSKTGKVKAVLPREVKEYVGFVAGNFSEGLAVVYADSYRFIDRKGRFVFDHKFGVMSRFSGGMASGWFNGKVVLINKQGKFIIPPRPIGKGMTISQPSDGLALLRSKKNKDTGREIIKYVNNRGEDVLEKAKYRAAGSFSEGLAEVSLDGKWGYIDKKGKEIIPPKYEITEPFSEGLAAVSVNGREYGFINKLGTFVIPPNGFDSLNHSRGFKNGLAYVWKEESGVRFEGYIDTVGKWVWKKEI